MGHGCGKIGIRPLLSSYNSAIYYPIWMGKFIGKVIWVGLADMYVYSVFDVHTRRVAATTN